MIGLHDPAFDAQLIEVGSAAALPARTIAIARTPLSRGHSDRPVCDMAWGGVLRWENVDAA